MLLTGGSGLLGGWLLRTAPDDVEVTALVHRRPVPGRPSVRADLRDRDATLAAVRAAAPDLVLHAAYVTDEPSIVDATRHVAGAAASVDAQVLLTSTDAVFAGDGRPRDEAAVPDPIFDYGHWKAAAERAVTAEGGGIVVRLPLLVSVDPDDHVVAKLRDAAATGGTTSWFTDEIRRPALAAEVAAALWRIVGLRAEDRAGVWHLPGPERLSRHDIATRVVDRLALPRAIVDGGPTPSGLARPRDLEFTGERAEHAIAWSPRPVLF